MDGGDRGEDGDGTNGLQQNKSPFHPCPVTIPTHGLVRLVSEEKGSTNLYPVYQREVPDCHSPRRTSSGIVTHTSPVALSPVWSDRLVPELCGDSRATYESYPGPCVRSRKNCVKNKGNLTGLTQRQWTLVSRNDCVGDSTSLSPLPVNLILSEWISSPSVD